MNDSHEDKPMIVKEKDGRIVRYVKEDGTPITYGEWSRYEWYDVTSIHDGYDVRKFVLGRL